MFVSDFVGRLGRPRSVCSFSSHPSDDVSHLCLSGGGVLAQEQPGGAGRRWSSRPTAAQEGQVAGIVRHTSRTRPDALHVCRNQEATLQDKSRYEGEIQRLVQQLQSSQPCSPSSSSSSSSGPAEGQSSEGSTSPLVRRERSRPTIVLF